MSDQTPVDDRAPNDDALLADRTKSLLEQAIAGLDPADTAERIAWCRAHNQHGVRMHVGDDDDVVEFRWGGRPLAMVPRSALLSGEPLRGEFISEVPDTLPDGWAEQ